MNKKFIIAALLVATVFTAGSVYAQGFGRGWDRDDRYGRPCGRGYGYGQGNRGEFGRLDAMKEELGLSDKQVKQIFDLGTQYREKSFENRNNPDKLADLRVEHRKAVESVLTKEQLDKYNRIEYGYGRYGWYGGCPGRW